MGVFLKFRIKSITKSHRKMDAIVWEPLKQSWGLNYGYRMVWDSTISAIRPIKLAQKGLFDASYLGDERGRRRAYKGTGLLYSGWKWKIKEEEERLLRELSSQISKMNRWRMCQDFTSPLTYLFSQCLVVLTDLPKSK